MIHVQTVRFPEALLIRTLRQYFQSSLGLLTPSISTGWLTSKGRHEVGALGRSNSGRLYYSRDSSGTCNYY